MTEEERKLSLPMTESYLDGKTRLRIVLQFWVQSSPLLYSNPMPDELLMTDSASALLLLSDDS